MKILITGGEGQLGRRVARAALALGHTADGPGRGVLDVTDAGGVLEALRAAMPDVVVHCAALTDTGRCEREPELALQVNARGTEIVAQACASIGARLVAVSTNEVFDGQSSVPYAEDAPPRAVNAYGASKLAGEQLATAAWGETLIVRTSWVFDAGSTSYVSRVVAGARSGRPLRFVTDEVACPTYAPDLAAGIVSLIDANAPAGVYHLTNEGDASRFDLAAEVLRLSGLPVEDELLPVTTVALRAGGYDGPVKPPYSALANTRAAALGVRLRPWREALAACMATEPQGVDA